MSYALKDTQVKNTRALPAAASATVDGAVLAAHLRMNLASGQIAESLARFLDTSVGCQLKRDGFHYLQQDGVDGRLVLSD